MNSDHPVTTLAPVDLKLPPLKAKHVAPVLEDLAHKLKALTGHPEIVVELERVVSSLKHIEHGKKYTFA